MIKSNLNELGNQQNYDHQRKRKEEKIENSYPFQIH